MKWGFKQTEPGEVVFKSLVVCQESARGCRWDLGPAGASCPSAVTAGDKGCPPGSPKHHHSSVFMTFIPPSTFKPEQEISPAVGQVPPWGRWDRGANSQSIRPCLDLPKLFICSVRDVFAQLLIGAGLGSDWN